MTFREACCQHFKWESKVFEEMIFRRCLYLHARPFGWLLRCFNRSFFQSDLEAITSLGEATGVRELMSEMGAYRYDYQLRKSFIRNKLRIRISGERIVRLGAQVFHEKGR